MNSSASHHPKTARRVVATVLVAFLGGIVALSFNLGSAHKSNGLTTTTLSSATSRYPNKNLPSSRDNDAGRARGLDSTPDNDTDAWQRG
jgi:hypothetical protein